MKSYTQLTREGRHQIYAFMKGLLRQCFRSLETSPPFRQKSLYSSHIA